MKKAVKYILFIILLLVMFFPALQAKYEYLDVKPLRGVFKERVNPKLTFDSWTSSEYQQKKEAYLNHNFGLRANLVRMYNEWRYTLYTKFSADNIYEGKDGYLFRFYGLKYNTKISDTYKRKLQSKVDKLKAVNDYVDSAFGTKVIVVITPQKEFFHPEYLTDELKHLSELPEKLDVILTRMDEHNLPYTNLNAYFISIKNQFEWPFYPRGGIHWSKTASYFAMDTIVKFMETVSGEDLANISYTEPTYTKGYVWDADMDIYHSSNLIRKWDELPLKYAELIPPTEGKKPKVITIADSYFNPPAWAGIPAMFFDSTSSYWYYNREFFDVNNAAIEKKNLREELTETDFVVVLTSIENLRNFTFGFADEAYEEFIENKPKD